MPAAGDSRPGPTGADVMPRGLSQQEAAGRLAATGPNELRHAAPPRAIDRLLRQFASPVIWLLLAACVMSAILGELLDAAAIAVILAVNAGVGFFQERRAERAIEALGAMTARRARVVRDGRQQIIAAREVVPGDVLLLEAGDVVAADARLVEAHALTLNEAALTGESFPVHKSAAPIAAEVSGDEPRGVVFMGTSVAGGTAIALVEATGMSSEFGKIAHLLETVEESATPLQRRLEHVSRWLAASCAAVVAVVAAIGVMRGWSAIDVFMSAVSLAVAAVPEGLPAVVTIALAVGVQRMAARQVLVRRLPAVETLGCATVICTDKTGTLTTGAMAVRELWGRDHDALLSAAAACCDAELGSDGRPGVGDPTEIAILAAARERGILRAEIERARPRVAVTPFDAREKFMSVTRADGVTYVKGAVDVLAPRVEAHEAAAAAEAHDRMAARGLRVLAVATSRAPGGDLDLMGLVGIADPPRAEASHAVAAARRAGITTVMITGDHPATARAIARELGIAEHADTGARLVHARAAPADKLHIIRDWKERGAVVAMTGDGVNDAPALREAHIGIAMGITGTEVAREAADMVLADDNFSSIVAAVHEGRGIFENIRKTLVYLLTGNVAELMVMLAAAIAGAPLPLLPLHLLWINIATDGLPALALVMDPAGEELLTQPPRDPQEPMLGRQQLGAIVATALVEAAVVLGAFMWALDGGDLARARGAAFSTLVCSELFRALAARSATLTFWQVGPRSNLRLVAVIAVSIALQLLLVSVPATRSLFDVGAMTRADLATAAILGLVPVSLVELRKLLADRQGA